MRTRDSDQSRFYWCLFKASFLSWRGRRRPRSPQCPCHGKWPLCGHRHRVVSLHLRPQGPEGGMEAERELVTADRLRALFLVPTSPHPSPCDLRSVLQSLRWAGSGVSLCRPDPLFQHLPACNPPSRFDMGGGGRERSLIWGDGGSKRRVAPDAPGA